MEEKNTIPEEGDGIEYKPTFWARVENFWYHYKWHSIVAAFLVVVLTICSVQMCTKESYDAYILYSGSYYVDRKSQNDLPEYLTFISSLSKVTEDFDGNKEINPFLLDLFVLSPEEIKAEEEKIGTEITHSLLNEDMDTLEYQILYGNEYFVCFMSEYSYNKYRVIDDVELFLPLAEYAGDNSSLEYLAKDAVYLHSTEFSKLPGICNLPKDTVICLRSINTVSSFLNKRHIEKRHEQAEQIIRNIFSYK